MIKEWLRKNDRDSLIFIAIGVAISVLIPTLLAEGLDKAVQGLLGVLLGLGVVLFVNESLS